METKDNRVQTDIDNGKVYRDTLSDSYKDEVKLYEDFFNKISHRASTHRQITLNNLDEIEEKLKYLKSQAFELKNSYFFHDEYTIVDRQEIIATTETMVQEQNKMFLDFHYEDKSELIDTVDFLNKALIQLKSTFFDKYQRNYLGDVLYNEKFFDYFQDASNRFNQILTAHEEDILSMFVKLNEDIKNMDDSVSEIIKKKNRQTTAINHFYEQEMKNYIDNQFVFSAASDPTSIDIQALVSDKIRQFEAFKNHVALEDRKITSMLKREQDKLYQSVLSRHLSRRSNLMTDSLSFFQNPEQSINEIKDTIERARKNKDRTLLKNANRQYQKAKEYVKIKSNCEQKAKHLVSHFERDKRNVILEYRLESNKVITELDQYLHLYQALMNKDTFLAQAIGDYSSKIIKDELNKLSMLQQNKELKTNINFDIESLKIKSKINELEMNMIYEVKRQMLIQELEIIDTITDIHQYIVDNKVTFFINKNQIQKESLSISRMEEAMNTHLAYLHETANINREWQSLLSGKLITQTRFDETHHIHVSEAASKIKLVLKEYDIKALHFETMLQNEMSYLVMQSSRVSEETEIHHEFVLTTYLNQMRFANEQMELAESEFRLRLEAIQAAINEEKTYFEDLIKNEMRVFDEEKNRMEDEFQAKLYQNRHLLTETSDRKIHKILEKEFLQLKKYRDDFLDRYAKNIGKNDLIVNARRRIVELDEEYIEAADDAINLREETIVQMTDVYQEASKRYETLKPYLENKMNILEPEFYQALKRINDRHHFKLKLAESYLDEASSLLIDEYRKVFFEEQQAPDLSVYEKMMNDLIQARENAEKQYSAKMQLIEDNYQIKVKVFDDELAKLQKSQLVMKQTVLQKNDVTKKSLELELAQVNNQYTLAKDAHGNKLKQQTKNLTSEYQEALVNSEKFIASLSYDFRKLLQSYEPYIKLQRKDKQFRKLMHTNAKVFHKQAKQNEKKIYKDIKTLQL